MSICRKSINLERYWAWLADDDTELAAAMVFRVAVANGSPPDGTTKPPRCRVASMVMILNCHVERLFGKIETRDTATAVLAMSGTVLYWKRIAYL